MNVIKLAPVDLRQLLTPERLEKALVVLLIIVGGYIVLRILTALTERLSRKRLSPQMTMILRKAVYYSGAVLLLMVVLRQLGFDLTALLGAAGIAGIAIGFASQTSVSNIISGLFLLSEKPFALGDVIKIEGSTGIVMSIDLMSIKIRTFDNQYIRIPNEKILNTELTNVTYFPIRRMDIHLQISYRNDFDHVRRILLEVADRNPYCLNEPEPLVIFSDFGASGQEILLGLWFAKDDFLALKNSIMEEIKERFDAEGIEIPFPHRTVSGGLRIESEAKKPGRPRRTRS